MTEINAEQELAKLSVRFTELIQQNSALAADNERLTEELIRACSELSGIKKQEPAAWAFEKQGFRAVDDFEEYLEIVEAEKVNAEQLAAYKEHDRVFALYAKPVHQHSFTISGIGTFYTDSELEITYLERLHGVGGKANLKEVTGER